MTHLVLGGAGVDAAVRVVGVADHERGDAVPVQGEGVLAGGSDALAVPVPGPSPSGTGEEIPVDR